MEKLILELIRLYLRPDAASRELLERQLLGGEALAIGQDGSGMTRLIAIAFDKPPAGDEARHWTRLCEVASLLQATYGFPVPAVSISGSSGYHLWLSLEEAIPADEALQFRELLHYAWLKDLPAQRDGARETVMLPPCLNPVTGKWAAFINPGMGASFVDEPGLEVAPPLAAQAAFLEQLQSSSVEHFRRSLQALRPSAALAEAAQSAESAPRGAIPPHADESGLLLRDATLEDIVRHLHAKNIEPTFRHLIPAKS